MPTTGPINGTIFRLYRNTAGTTYTALGHSTTCSISFSHSPRTITSQDSAGWDEVLEGLRSATISTSGFQADDATEGAAEYLDELLDSTARGAVTWQVTTNVSGDYIYSGDAYIESIEINNSGPEETATYSISLKVTGAVTKSTV